MITYSNDSIFDCNAVAIVNAVNCVGVMGAGLAKAFADKFPEMNMDYMEYCKTGILKPGKLHTYLSMLPPSKHRIIVNLPTKDDWRDPSEYIYVVDGMETLANFVSRFAISSVGVPALGCGLGGLEWPKVNEIIEYYAELVPSTHWTVFPPQ